VTLKAFYQSAGLPGGPLPFQERFARELHPLVHVPTGLGKTAMVVLGWLWRRHAAGAKIRDATPRRLVYCLPMRVLVEQTRDNAEQWVHSLHQKGAIDQRPCVHVLMGGEHGGEWEMHPDRDMILVGTQDMLLSRALNRGYAASRSRWPMQFGLLHTDCLWIFDEIQLMGSGLATTAQLEAFRRLLPREGADLAERRHGCRSVWMSATLNARWLGTVDFNEFLPNEPRLAFDYQSEIASQGIHQKAKKVLEDRWKAAKPLSRASAAIGDHEGLAAEIAEKHAERRGLTLVVVNTVRRAQELHEAIGKHRWDDDAPALLLLHSRFRPPDRERKVRELLDRELNKDMICVSTQVVEAGVDVDATTLFTDLAPWASLVQRFGRCNRKGEVADAQVRWVDLPAKNADAEKERFPYELPDLRAAAAQLATLSDVGLGSLARHVEQLSDDDRNALFPHEHTHVIRRKDLIDLFDTTPDLAGNDIDIDRYVRDIEETSVVRVFWRVWDLEDSRTPPADKAWRRIGRDELCPTPIDEFRKFAVSAEGKGKVWRWDFTNGAWEQVREKDSIYPGQTYLVHASAGGYESDRGWAGAAGEAAVEPLGPVEPEGLSDDAYDDDGLSKTDEWQTIATHTDKVCGEAEKIVEIPALTDRERVALRAAARWHDWGKAHNMFQAVLPEGAPRTDELWAKASGDWKRYREVGRANFRHELASALGVLRPDVLHETLDGADRDLVAYLIAAHHGKVRLSIRSMPKEMRPRSDNGTPRRFARGVWDGEELPEVDLGDGVVAPKVRLSLEPMEIGLCEEEPFADQPSWLERAIKLRDTLGPFRLAYLEALLRAADWRASAAAVTGDPPAEPEEAAHA